MFPRLVPKHVRVQPRVPAHPRRACRISTRGSVCLVTSLPRPRLTQITSDTPVYTRALSVTTTTPASTNRDRRPSTISQHLSDNDAEAITSKRFKDFALDGRVFVVTGGAQGLGLTLAEGLVEAGGHVYCLDRLERPPDLFSFRKEHLSERFEGSLHYRHVDVQEAAHLDQVIGGIAADHGRMDGLVAAAGVQYVCPALDYPPEEIMKMININYTGVYLSAVSTARAMIHHRTPGSICLIGSMSGLIANKGLTSSVYNSSKAAVIQLGRSLAMEWGRIPEFEDLKQDENRINSNSSKSRKASERKRGIRVNVLCPGNIMTPMVRKNFEDDPELKALWERENMMGRISEPDEYKAAVVFMLSDASSFMTGSHLVVDGGYTAW